MAVEAQLEQEVRRQAGAVRFVLYSPELDPQAPVPIGRSVLADDLLEVSVGLRIELSEWSVVKIQGELERTGDTAVGAGLINWSFGI